MKKCFSCKQLLNRLHFHKDRTKKDGLYTLCKRCRRKRSGVKERNYCKVIDTIDGYEVIIGKRKYPVIKSNEGSIRVHRYLMEKEIGRKLETREHVHHKDGNKMNYALSNLVILTKSEHHKLHGQGKVNNSYILNCNICGKKRRFYPYYLKYYKGSVETARKAYLCQEHYYQSKRWLHDKNKN